MSPAYVSQPVVLGKDCQISGDGISNSEVRSASFSYSAKEVEYQPYGTRQVSRYSVGWDFTVEVELIADPTLYDQMKSGSLINLTTPAGGGTFIITSLVRSEPLDDVATVKLTLKPSLHGAGE